MQYFTIRDIENLCQIKAHTLRIWEQRYGLFLPKRKESLHRIYDNDDLRQLLRISFLYHNGWKISKIAALSPEQIADEVDSAEINSTSYKNFITQLIEAAVDFNEGAFTQLLDKIILKIGFEKCITDVCYPFLQRIGLLWLTNNIIPAQEHFCSYLIQNKLIAETEKISLSTNNANVLLFSPKGEHHELPLLFLNYLLKKNGWSTLYLGVNITKETLQPFENNQHIEYLMLHHITNFTGWQAEVYFEDLCKTFRSKKIIATGTTVHQIQRNFTNLQLLKSDREIYEFIEKERILPGTSKPT